MRILLISRCPPYPLHLGDRLIVYHLARELRSRGHEIDLLAFAPDGISADEQVHYAAFFRSMTFLPEPARPQSDYLFRLLNVQARFAHSADQSWSPAMWNAIRDHIRTNRYDVAHLFGGIQVYEYAPALGDLPAMITPYESYTLYLKRAKVAAPSLQKRFALEIQRRIARAFESFMFTPYPVTTVVAAPDRDMLKSINPRLRVEVIPNGVDTNTFSPDNTPRVKNRLVFTGNFEYPPNVDAALRLAQNILPKLKHSVSVTLVGNAPPPELLALKQGHIDVTGRVPDLRPYLRGASVYVSALRMGAGIKNKILEALAVGVPVVATRISVDGIFAKHGEHLLIADSDDEIAAGVDRLLADSDLRERLSANGSALVRTRYSWAQTAEQVERLYHEVGKQG